MSSLGGPTFQKNKCEIGCQFNEKIVSQSQNNLAYSFLTTALAPSFCNEITLVYAY